MRVRCVASISPAARDLQTWPAIGALNTVIARSLAPRIQAGALDRSRTPAICFVADSVDLSRPLDVNSASQPEIPIFPIPAHLSDQQVVWRAASSCHSRFAQNSFCYPQLIPSGHN